MPSITDNCTTCIALALAAVTAVMSMPGHHMVTAHEASQWLTRSVVPEIEAMAGAIGENTEQFAAP
jgi:hypothetical protein